jgi:hypothetical protein
MTSKGDDGASAEPHTGWMSAVERCPYQIRIRGRLTDRFADAFLGMEMVPGRQETILLGVIEDQAHLFGVLDRIRDLGLDLLSVEPDHEPKLAS